MLCASKYQGVNNNTVVCLKPISNKIYSVDITQGVTQKLTVAEMLSIYAPLISMVRLHEPRQ